MNGRGSTRCLTFGSCLSLIAGTAFLSPSCLAEPAVPVQATVREKPQADAEADGEPSGARSKSNKPTFANDRKTLPRALPYQAELYRWMSGVSLKDVELPPRDLAWYGTVKDQNDLANNWLALALGRGEIGVPYIMKGDAKWFVLNDGHGGGIEGSGGVLQLRWPAGAAFWYQLSLPLADGKDGNPCYRNRALALRVMIATAVDMMMLDDSHDKIDELRRSDFLGGTMNAWTYAFQQCGDVLPPQARTAYEQGFDRMLDKLLEWGPRDVTPNMDTRAISAVARLYFCCDDKRIRDKCLRIARRFLFGKDDGALATINSKKGIFYPAGYVGEGEGPETTYNGVSLYNILMARCVTSDNVEWSFLDEVLRRMLDFKLYQYLPEPNGTVTGPAGYASRTGAPYTRDQRSLVWRQIAAADMYVEGRPLARDYFSPGDAGPTVAAMTSQIKVALQQLKLGRRKAGFATPDHSQPGFWEADHEEHWPPDVPYYPPPGWLGRLQQLVGKNDPTTWAPFERPDAGFNRQFGPPGAEEFWAFRKHDERQDFGFIIEHVPRNWTYGSWAGGSLQAFWIRSAGVLFLTRHDKASDHRWSEIDTWGTNHVWGKTGGGYFSSATYHKGDTPPQVASSINGRGPAVEFKSGFGWSGEGGLQAQIVQRWQVLSDGLGVSLRIRSDGQQQCSELWATLPVYSGEGSGKRAPASLGNDSIIEFWDGGGWKPMSAAVANTARIRLGKKVDSKLVYGFVIFDSPRRVKLSSQVWQAEYQTSTRLRNIHIDLHPATGTPRALPNEISLSYAIRTSDPGNSG